MTTTTFMRRRALTAISGAGAARGGGGFGGCEIPSTSGRIFTTKMMGFLSDANGSNATTDDNDYVGNGKNSILKQQRGQNYTQMRAYANDPTIDKGLFPSARKKHERELNAERKKWREEFELEAEKRREKKEKEDETKHREREERRRLKATAFKNTTGEREALKKENDKRREEKRAKTERILKQKLAATERRSRWRNVELYAEATKWITREDLEKRIEKALNRPERMY
ncbi:unnamed protein product [Bathycoccus prasinos]